MSFMLILNYNYSKTIYNFFFSLREKEYNTKVSLSVFERLITFNYVYVCEYVQVPAEGRRRH